MGFEKLGNHMACWIESTKYLGLIVSSRSSLTANTCFASWIEQLIKGVFHC